MHNKPTSLAELNQRVALDLDYLTLPASPWVPQQAINGQDVLDVAVIGGGMAGLSAAASLVHLGVKAVIYDARPEGFEGPWATTARMETLRSPKTLTGPAIGIASLTFRAWFEAQFGLEAWEKLDKIPRLQWMDYLRWYRQVLNLDLRNEHQVTLIRPQGDHVCVEIKTPEGNKQVLARHVVLATGRDGLGGPYVPEIIQALPADMWAHSSDHYDYNQLKGKRIAVVGAGASAMDSAGTALEAGAERVDILIRRKDIPRINRGKGMGNPGSTYGMQNLDIEWKLKIHTYLNAQQVPPPRASVLRVSAHDNAHFHLDCGLINIQMQGDQIEIETTQGTRSFDFVIASTGFQVDWAQKPFLAEVERCARLWSDRLEPLHSDADKTLLGALLGLPDLGPAFEFQPKTDADGCAGIERVHCFCYPAVLSHGAVSGDIPSISEGAARLSQGIVASLYHEDIASHYVTMTNYAEPEVFGDEWVAASGFDENPAGDAAASLAQSEVLA